MKRRTDDTPSLFDPPMPIVAPEPTESDWREVPQPLFLSWSPLMQWAYCRDRDLDSAMFAESHDMAVFFMARAEMYRQMIEGAM
jgi:hypothetical protein